MHNQLIEFQTVALIHHENKHTQRYLRISAETNEW